MFGATMVPSVRTVKVPLRVVSATTERRILSPGLMSPSASRWRTTLPMVPSRSLGVIGLQRALELLARRQGARPVHDDLRRTARGETGQHEDRQERTAHQSSPLAAAERVR